MVRIAVFGANGLVGTALKNRASLYDNVDLIPLSRADVDISDLKAVMGYFVDNNDKFDTVINLASITDSNLCEKNRKLCFSNNADGSKFVSFWANYYKKPLVYLSTLESVWNNDNYPLSKLRAEEEVAKFYNNRILKTYNIYSSLESDNSLASKAIRDIYNNKVDFEVSKKITAITSANSVCDKLLKTCGALSESKAFSPTLIVNYIDSDSINEFELYKFIAEKLNKKINLQIKEENNNKLEEEIKSDILSFSYLYNLGKSWKDNLSEVIDEVVAREKNKIENSTYSMPVFNFQSSYDEGFDI